MVGRPAAAAAAGGGGLILGDQQAQGACWDFYLFVVYSRQLLFIRGNFYLFVEIFF
jgi:hypothetical protein